MVHALVVTIRLTAEEHAPFFLGKLAELAAHSADSEPNTLLYEVFTQKPPVEDEDDDEAKKCRRTFVIMERYTQHSDLMDVHMASAPFNAFAQWLTSRGNITDKAQCTEEGDGIVESIEFQHLCENGVQPRLRQLTEPILARRAESRRLEEMQRGDAARAAAEKRSAAEAAELPVHDGCLVFCGARPGNDPTFEQHAERIGELLAKAAVPLVYGGGSIGVMGQLARSVVANGGVVQGVIPEALAPREVSGNELGNPPLFCDTMSERKGMMFRMSNQVICLAGGIGTLDEFFEVLTLFQLGGYRPRIGILNTNNFYGPLLSMLEHLVRTGFLNADAMEYFVVEKDPDALWERMKAFEPPESAAKGLKWPKNKY